ncbi:cytochrome c-type biogenesis protein [uncultured Parasphingorhabdus sp.]|uniref:cytochrome c-type biogenesis protein n=1 Tax=uncultured Parasphingorhabdus sp. TaxID=2709694 RepID=UPI0030D93877|tara:strand:- start:9214 stop:9633 length:420 start_codon:yes stop_codon:yes gene_type:complete
MKRFLALLIIMGLAVPVAAQTGLPPAPYANRQLDDPQQEAAARDLMDELRCLKCQSQSIADSNAPMAGDMRSQVREKIAAGESPEAVRSWLVERYGNWVSYNPPIASAVTWPLWMAPIILLLAALWLARGRFRKPKDDE